MFSFNNINLKDLFSNGRRLFQLKLGDRLIWERDRNFRFVRDTLRGNSVNNDNHWIEIQVFNDSGVNIARGLLPTSNGGRPLTTNRYLHWLTDENTTDTNRYYGIDNVRNPSKVSSMTIDLGTEQTIDNIKIWHYYSDNRSYNSTVEVSKDGRNWVTIFNGSYREESSGKTHKL